MAETRHDLHSPYQSKGFVRHLRGRRGRDRWIPLAGVVSLAIAVAFLAILIGSIVARGYSAFALTEIRLPVTFKPSTLEVPQDAGEEELRGARYDQLLEHALAERLGAVEGRAAEQAQQSLVTGAATRLLRRQLLDNPEWLGTTQEVWIPASAAVDQIVKGNQPRDIPQDDRSVSDRQLAWVDQLRADGNLALHPNWAFFTSSDSRTPATSGVLGAVIGSLLTLGVTFVLAFPIAVAAAIYLEEFAPKTWWTRLIEVSINNLAAVPSIVFGLLGLSVFLNLFGLPRSAPLVGGLVLTLMTLPIIIVAARSSLKAVPPNLRQAALMLGASRQQTIFMQVLPQALPGMLTGSIIGMAQALGETAPLLLIGMIAFVSAPPDGFLDTATVLPAQIYMWFTNPETAYRERASAAILVLLAMMILLNSLAVYLRHRLQRSS